MKKLIILLSFINLIFCQNRTSAAIPCLVNHSTILADTTKQEQSKIDKPIDKKRSRMITLTKICLIGGGVLLGVGSIQSLEPCYNAYSMCTNGLAGIAFGLLLVFLGVVVWLLQVVGSSFKNKK